MATCLIVGASRGIGLELARQYAADGERVIGTHRKAQDAALLAQFCARSVAVDLLEPDACAHLAGQVADERIDLAVIAAGISGPTGSRIAPPERSEFDQVMRTNVLTSMQLIPLLAAGALAPDGKIVALSSMMGSIAGTSNASWWLYRASKAALNSVVRSASTQLGPAGAICLAMHPGWVRTDMGGPSAHLSVQESAAAMRRVIAAANRSHNGHFLNYNGEQMEW